MTANSNSSSKLNILVSLNGLSFYAKKSSETEPEVFKSISFSTTERAEKIEDLLIEVFNKNYELTQKYDEVVVIHANNLATFVPNELFDEEYLGSYLQYTTKVFETDFFTFDALLKYEMYAVYIPYVNMNNFFIDYYGSFSYQHSSSILVANLLEIAVQSNEKIMYVHVAENNFEIVLLQKNKLLFYNSFDYKSAQDFIYYVLFTAEQLQLNPDNFQMQLLGSITENDDLYQVCYKYIRNVALLKSETSSNTYTEAQNRHHYILLNA